MLNAAGEGFEATHVICSARFRGQTWPSVYWDADSTAKPDMGPLKQRWDVLGCEDLGSNFQRDTVIYNHSNRL